MQFVHEADSDDSLFSTRIMQGEPAYISLVLRLPGPGLYASLSATNKERKKIKKIKKKPRAIV